MRFSYILILTLVICTVVGLYIFLVPMRVLEVKVEIPYGASVSTSGALLKDAGVIRSQDGYALLTRVLYPEGIVAGRYSFSGEVPLISVLYRLAHGQFGTKQVRITIPEGFTNEEITNRLSANFPQFKKEDIKTKLPKLDGYIYPETYFFDADASLDEIVIKITETGHKKISAILSPIAIESSEAKRILTVASLVEAEGKSEDERKMIAGVIENRLNADMPLQLDATLTYLTNKGSSQLTKTDLKLDSPYNTYVYKGLPPGPINNPGEESIRAAMNPTQSGYLFYLHGRDEQIHYARTYSEHLKNKDKYLR